MATDFWQTPGGFQIQIHSVRKNQSVAQGEGPDTHHFLSLANTLERPFGGLFGQNSQWLTSKYLTRVLRASLFCNMGADLKIGTISGVCTGFNSLVSLAFACIADFHDRLFSVLHFFGFTRRLTVHYLDYLGWLLAQIAGSFALTPGACGGAPIQKTFVIKRSNPAKIKSPWGR